MTIPITVITGFLGAGKTTLVLSLLPRLPPDYKVVLLKNEFGDVEVDSKLAQHSSLAAVTEILNGCMCCVLVGQMTDACLEIREKYRPDRIIIECSGSAFPATLAFQLRTLQADTNGGFKLDAIVTVIDAENFSGYADTSPTAKMQASYTDLILINKWELVSEAKLERVLDHLHTLTDLTPKLRCEGKNGIDPQLIFGLESRFFLQGSEYPLVHDDVETVSIVNSTLMRPSSEHGDGHQHSLPNKTGIDKELLEVALGAVSKESIWRIKGFVRLQGAGLHVINWAFGRYELTAVNDDIIEAGVVVKLTAMGERGEVRRRVNGLATKLGCQIS